MRLFHVQRYTYYFILGVSAYLSLAYYIHFRAQEPLGINIQGPIDSGIEVSTGFKQNRIYPEDSALRVTRDFRKRDKLSSSSDANLGDYSNYYGVDNNVPLEVLPMETNESRSNFNFEEIQFTSVRFMKIEQIYVYAAFLDKRIENKTYVRIFALQKINDLENILCGFSTDSGQHVTTVHTEKYEMCENHGKKYGGYIYSCVVPTSLDSSPYTVFLSTYSTFLDKHPHYLSMNPIPLHRNTNLDIGRMFFGVCLPPIFGHIALNILVQYIELTKLLGGSKLFFYQYNVSKNVEKLLKYYSARGDVEVLQWSLPGGMGYKDIWYHGQLLAIQDCLYRNMAQFQFLLFADLDELLIPHQTNNWITMLHNIASNLPVDMSSISGFSFQSVFFDPKQIPDPNQTLHFLQQLDRSKQASSVRTKLLVQPSHVFELGIHHMSKPIRENMTVVNVSPNEALLHHYRKCVIMFDSNMKCYPEVRDETILKYATLLNKRTAHVMSHITKLIQ